VGTAILVTLLVLLAVGIVIDQLLRIKKRPKRPPITPPEVAVGVPPVGSGRIRRNNAGPWHECGTYCSARQGDSITSSAVDSGSLNSTIGRDWQSRADFDVVDIG